MRISGSQISLSARGIWLIPLLLLVLSLTSRGEIMDKVVAMVGNQAITESEVLRQIRLQSLFNNEPAKHSLDRRREALERLIDRHLVRTEMITARFQEVEQEEVEDELDDLKRNHFVNQQQFNRSLKALDLTAEDVQEFTRRLVEFERFVDARFRAGMIIPRPRVEEYYKTVYVPEHERLHGTPALPLADVDDQIEEILVRRRVNESLEEWLREQRARTRVIVLDESLGLRDNERKDSEPSNPLIPAQVQESGEGPTGPAAYSSK